MNLKIACVQLNPVIGKFEENCKRASLLLEKAFPSNSKDVVKHPDIVVLPELALTGYNFANQKAIEPFLESTTSGPSTDFGVQISKRYNCFTLIGYPEKSIITTKSQIQDTSNDFEIYNSAVLISPTGSILFNYRKNFLYETDEKWGCSSNPKGFQTFNLNLNKKAYGDNGIDPNIISKIVPASIGICMDLNPYKFEAPFNKLEFANHCLETGARLILCPTAWLSHESPSIRTDISDNEKKRISNKYQSYITDSPDSKNERFQIDNNGGNIDFPQIKQEIHPDKKSFTSEQNYNIFKPDHSVINYWIIRFFPFLNHLYKRQSPFLKPTVVVMCNRSGIEKDVLYGGSSTILKFNNNKPCLSKDENFEDVDSRNDSVDVLGYLGQGTEGVLVRDVELEGI
ncbi:hypothetical protein PACTADRAFT_49511 [Pachysolen tannophilus NRRL Y-2460]|uniref:CN hydrolase domain-containing protein n=1 Tax=Pachysolen tannophilus NRRL Y-2460 TaxID=669874 RepID=A0A1E4TWJ3_PACTA|nr:hypothetical protein PACTADRAFT_49511 [Pachysolen tannophilus NRRL Y-2460]